jgi:hypothetical protein
LGLDRSDYSLAVQDKIIYAGVTHRSFSAGSHALAKLSALTISAKQVERVVKRIGLERCTERDEAVAAYQALPLVERKGQPTGVTPPAVAVVGTDGGRLQILERRPAATAAGPTPAPAGADAPSALAEAAPAEPPQRVAAGPAPPPVPAGADAPSALAEAAPAEPPQRVAVGPAPPTAAVTAAGPAAADPPPTAAGTERGRYWREDKVGLLMAMTSDVSATDPCPDLPEGFLDPTRMGKLVRELRKGVPVTEEPAQEATDPEGDREAVQHGATPWQPPKVEAKRLLASRQNWDTFGPMVAAAAWSMGLFAAARRAFVGDGAENNWTVWRRYFGSFEPILDFIHALSYVYAAAHAGRGRAEGWRWYAVWIRWVWQGQVTQVLEALRQRQGELGEPTAADKETSPRQVVATARTYLENNQQRMRYDVYRRQGLPITSSYVESAVKQFNQRAKGTEMFWGEEGAEAILQLRGDHLSDDQPLDAFWERRQEEATGQRPYRRAG